MARGFVREGDELETRLIPLERAMIRQLLDELCALLATQDSPEPQDIDPLARQLGMVGLDDLPVSPPDDPVLARLLPDGYRDDPMAASEFRRYTDGTLRQGKIADADIVRAGLDRAEQDKNGATWVSAQDAPAWLRSINDVRLALGVQLEITAESAEDLGDIPDDDPRANTAAIYDFLTWWQDSLVRALMGED